jgi:hypothetical protein
MMFVDDDVVLDEACIRELLQGLLNAPKYGALAADYLGESQGGFRTSHVAMGATLFRRSALSHVRFRWEPGKCECQCCCNDLRGLGWEIGYLPSARARHVRRTRTQNGQREHSTQIDIAPTGQILAAFDTRHFERFRQRFLRTLSATGDASPVTVVAYGLSMEQARLLAREPNVADVHVHRMSDVSPAIRRLEDFQPILEQWPTETLVAYWDAGDVLFQGTLDPLWKLARECDRRLLAVPEAISHPQNRAVANWTSRIPDLAVRNQVFELLAHRPFLNSGFACGTAHTLLSYCAFGNSFLQRNGLLLDAWSDQLALNVYCHSNSERWQEAELRWNFCLFGRDLEYRLERNIGDGDGGQLPWPRHPRVVADKVADVRVVHGNALSWDDAMIRWDTGNPLVKLPR